MKLKISMAVIAALLSGCGGGSDNKPAPVVETPPPVVEAPPPANVAPVADAGADISIDEQTAVTLSGNATDSDGTIASYLWTQTSGTSVTLTSSDKAQAGFTAPDINANETLTFSLTVTDDDGANHSDEVAVNVKHVNISPVANAGDDIEAYEDSTTVISGSGSDADGSIVSYSWQQTSGIEVSLTNTDKAELSVALPKLAQDETLTFELTVTDNSGATHSDITSMLAKPLTWETQSVKLIDIDGDSSLDLLIRQKSAGSKAQIVWSKGSDNGRFSSPSLIARFTDDILDGYELNDIDGDGKPELLSKYFDKDKSNAYVAWYPIKELTQLVGRRVIHSSAASEEFKFELSNIDGKGKQDLILIFDDKIQSRIQVADGNFAEPTVMTENWTIVDNYMPERQTVFRPSRYNLVDLNGDNLADIVWQATDASKGSFYYLLVYAAINNGNGQFSTPKLLAVNTDSQSSSSTAQLSYGFTDIDGDNVKDVTISSGDRSSMTQHRTVEFEWHKLTANHQESTIFKTGGAIDFGYPSKFDWNEDGITDYIIDLNYLFSDNYHSLIALGQGNGIFAEPIIIEKKVTAGSNGYNYEIKLDNDDIADYVAARNELIIDENNNYHNKNYVFWQKKLISDVGSEQKLFEYKGYFKGAHDLNKDGHVDFLSTENGILYWFQNNGNLTFTEKQITIPK